MIVVCLKWVSHPGEPDDERFAGMSAADQSALEFALRQAAPTGTTVTCITVGPSGAARVLRDALAAGAGRAVHVMTNDTLTSEQVADRLAAAISSAGDVEWVWCGDYSLDRGTGSVPAYLAARLTAQQALGIIAARLDEDHVVATRRLDGGRREILAVRPPAVVSVEGGTAALRRAGLRALRSAADAPLETLTSNPVTDRTDPVVRPYRPRARALAAPAGEAPLQRLRLLTDAGSNAGVARRDPVVLSPDEAARRILDSLHQWGYVDGD
jgi:electron transfer flavoprotein beta subunit